MHIVLCICICTVTADIATATITQSTMTQTQLKHPKCNIRQCAVCNLAGWPVVGVFVRIGHLPFSSALRSLSRVSFLFTLALVLAVWICFWRFETAICLCGTIHKQHTTQTAATQFIRCPLQGPGNLQGYLPQGDKYHSVSSLAKTGQQNLKIKKNAIRKMDNYLV